MSFVLDWAKLPSTFLTRTVGPLASEVAEAERSILELATYVDTPPAVLLAETLLNADDGIENALAATLDRRGYRRKLSPNTLRPLRRVEAALPEGATSELAPYLMEPVVGGYRLDGSRVTTQDERARRRLHAAYFTPPDVARAMVEIARSEGRGWQSVLDPCCGTGVFLREWVRAHADEIDSQTLLDSLRGIDLDPRSLDVCSAVLAYELGLAGEGWRSVRGHLVRGDSIELLLSGELGRHSVVIGNPPYGRGPEGGDRAAIFLRIMIEALEPGGVGVFVVPASVVTASIGDMASIRKTIVESGTTTFLNYDRSPDSLFGDDIKQRATIVVHRNIAERKLRTSALLRWRRSERAVALRQRNTVSLDGWPFDIVPAIESPLEASLIREILGMRATTTKRGRVPRRSGHDVSVAGTAYNWIPAELGTRALQSGGRRVVRHETARDAAAFYAALTSNVAYWLWRTTGDGFHVSARFVGRVETIVSHVRGAEAGLLADLGAELWALAGARPVEAVNKGVRTVAYVPPADSVQMSDVDAILLEALGLSKQEQGAFVGTVLKAARQSHTGSERST